MDRQFASNRGAPTTRQIREVDGWPSLEARPGQVTTDADIRRARDAVNAKDGWAADTSFALAALDEAHEAHAICRKVVRARRPALAGHASFETFSVLTRLPGVSAVEPVTAGVLLDRAFPERSWLTAKQHDALLRRLPQLGVAGGMVYDALVGESARAGQPNLAHAGQASPANVRSDRRALRVRRMMAG